MSRLSALQSPHPSGAVRFLLVAEPIVWSVLVTVYFCLRPADGQALWIDVLFAIYLIGVPIGLNLLHGDRPADSGIRLDTMKQSFIDVGAATLIMAGVLMAVSWMSDGWHWDDWGRFGEKIGMYVGWGLVQQYILQAFTVVRLRQAGLSKLATVLLASLLFSIVHTPNLALMILTFLAGLTWCSLFLKCRNLLPLGLSHAALATLAYFAMPQEWMIRNLIGAQYIEKVWGG
ncbi:MAG: CPBP family intramembrane glutamic endopeptidase [Phycisphaerae bacterium]